MIGRNFNYIPMKLSKVIWKCPRIVHIIRITKLGAKTDQNHVLKHSVDKTEDAKL